MTDTTISFPHSLLISFFGSYESREPFLPLHSFSSCSFIIFSLWREPSNTGPYFLALENHLAHLNDNISKFCNRFCLFQNSLISDNLKTPCNLRISKYPNPKPSITWEEWLLSSVCVIIGREHFEIGMWGYAFLHCLLPTGSDLST